MNTNIHFHECEAPSVVVVPMEYLSKHEEPINEEGVYTCAVRNRGWHVVIDPNHEPFRYTFLVESEEKPSVSVEPFKTLKTPVEYGKPDEFHRGWSVKIDAAGADLSVSVRNKQAA